MIATQHLFRPLNQELLSLLRDLTAEEWPLPTVAGHWRVQDVAAHLLDGMLRRLSIARDGHQIPSARPLDSPADLALFINELNAEGVKLGARFSRKVLISLLDVACEELAEYFAGLDPYGEALFPVSWAGQNRSPQWLDIGREYTEHWHHQQQIRLATGRPLQLDRRFGQPAMALFLFALPFAYRDTPAEEGCEIEIAIEGDAGQVATLRREDAEWLLERRRTSSPAARISLRDADAWLLFTKGLRAAEAAAALTGEGPPELLSPFLRTLAIVG